MKSYSELIKIPTFEERFNYLKIYGDIGAETFGKDRILNQALYTSMDWRNFRHKVIVRDNGCDLAFDDGNHTIYEYIFIHHINPITSEDIINRRSNIFDMENVVCVSRLTHNALHFGSLETLPKSLIERKPYDTCPWR